MKKITTTLLLLAITTLLLQGQLIINHLNTDITTLTEAEINLAKQTLHIVYGHTSHGSQLISGMNGLVDFANAGGKGMAFPENIFAWNYDGWDGALDLRDGDGLPGDVGYYPDWYNASRAYLEEAGNASRNVMMWSWCGQVSWYSEKNITDWYLTPMSQLENDFPNVKFVYMTGHLDGTGIAGNLHLRNEQIRNYCIANKKILYDFNDIECYDPDQLVNYLPLDATDNCDYDSSGFSRNWAIRWQNSHTENVDWYDCGAAHSQSLNGNQKAYAAWRMFAEIAKLIVSESIPAELTVTDTIIGNGETACFDATDTLTVTGEGDLVEFQEGSTVDLIAGNTIRLLPGFHAFEGSIMNASITTTAAFCDHSTTTPSPVYRDKSVVMSGDVSRKKAELENKRLALYPNPNNGEFTVELTNFEDATQLMIYNPMGQRVYDVTLTGQQHLVSLPKLQRGIYFLKAIHNEKQYDKKILVK